MAAASSFLIELEDAVSRGTPESCLRALWHASDILMAGRYSEDQIATFGEVINRLAEEIEHTARAELSDKLAPSSNAPFSVIRKLAFDDSIDIAGPVLQQSERIDNKTLIATARSKSQQHLLAISKRKSLSDAVTDVLVVRGSAEVVTSVAANDGARFSGLGFLHLLQRSEDDSILAEQLGLRKDIPRHLFQQLIAKASDDVRKRLEHERPEMGEEIGSSVVDVAGALQSKFGPVSRSYFVAKRVVTNQYRLGNLAEESLAGYAIAHRIEEVTIGLSLLTSLPGDVIERALVDRNREMLLILAKALKFSWQTTMALLFLGAKDHRITARELRDLERDFCRLNVETSKSVLEFYRSRKNAGPADAGLAREPQFAMN
jgi:hypothetical protein